MYVDRRLAGIQAVQTLSRLNRAYDGKNETYVVDFVNDPEEVLAAFKTYHATAELSAATDPNIVYDLRAKLDAAGHYDDFEVDRVVAVELKPDASRAGPEGRSGRQGCPRRTGRADPLQDRHGRVRPPVHVPVPDFQLRQHGHREARHLLQAADTAAGVRP
jgi:hypothetical protein